MEWLAEYGYIGLFFGAFLAATVIPFSSEIILTLVLEAGKDPITAILVATIGNWLGGMTSYGIGWLGKWEWIEKWLRVSREKLEKQQDKISKYGSLLAFLTWLPAIGDLLAVALGFYRVSFSKSALFMFVGKCTRFTIWSLIYFWLRPYLNI